MNKKSMIMKISIALVIFSSGIITTGAVFLTITSNNTAEFNVFVINDSSTSIPQKSRQLFSELLTNEDFSLIYKEVSSEKGFRSAFKNQNYDIMVFIGHGDNDGMYFGEDLISWDSIREMKSNESQLTMVFLSCYSANLLVNHSNLFNLNNTICFEEKIDYVAASYVAAVKLAEIIDNDALFGRVYKSAEANIDYIVDHAFNCLEPLWHGVIHDGVALWSLYSDLPSNLSSLLPFSIKPELIEASEADKVDLVNEATYWKIMTSAERRRLWLKHNYGQRLGITICLHLPLVSIPIFNIPAAKGTAPQAAQDAYNTAVAAFKNKDYVGAGNYLSYAVHYGQDMTMPHHVFDYLSLHLSLNLVNLIINIARIVDDHYHKKTHDKVENYASDLWDSLSFKNEVFASASSQSITIEPGEKGVYNTVTSIAEWTKSQVTKNQIRQIINSEDELLINQTIIKFLAKAMAYTTALYKRFILDVCGKPSIPEIVDVPEYGFVDYPQKLEVRSVDPQGDDVLFEINWGDGTFSLTEYEESGSTVPVMHTYHNAGVYNVSVRVKDFHVPEYWTEFCDCQSIEIRKSTAPPIPSKPVITGPTIIDINTNGFFRAVSYDPDGNYLIFTFNFGDGYTWTSELVRSGEIVSHFHSYAQLGTMSLKVTVQNTRGGKNSNTIPIEVIEPEPENLPPNVPIIASGPVEGYFDESYQFTFIGTDPEDDKINYEVDWGDGTISYTEFQESGTEISFSHQWAEEGAYRIQVRTQDQFGAYSEWSEMHAIIIYDPDGPIIIPGYIFDGALLKL